ncbi:helix-turn-helix transcriptional regulator [Agromyces sp. LHK192]|uniref:helix-turn-helix transcriptional regulator n=1 Tax=Agromyces sp. LHK192 TaxID=2498704 RepID=UPI000FD80244|nr:helix-turn-helix transcriptional regulator [Agromyces sp. LHK192]
MDEGSGREPIGAPERSGVLAPGNLARYSAQRLRPAAAIADLVDTYWSVSWSFPRDEAVVQRIIDHPAITLSVEEGSVPSPLTVSCVRPGAWKRTIEGRGSVFAIRLRPAGLAVVADLDAAALAREQPLTPSLDRRAHELLSAVAAVPASDLDGRAGAADAAIARALAERRPSPAGILANNAVDALVESPRIRPIDAIAHELGVSARTLQRACRATLGIGPGHVARRVRLQEVVRRLSVVDADVGATAAELGYADQAHLINDFRHATGLTPGAHVSEERRTREQLVGGGGLD